MPTKRQGSLTSAAQSVKPAPDAHCSNPHCLGAGLPFPLEQSSYKQYHVPSYTHLSLPNYASQPLSIRYNSTPSGPHSKMQLAQLREGPILIPKLID